MKKRIIKLIISFLLIASLMVGFSSAFASAAQPVWLLRAKAAIAAAMLASNLVISPVNAFVDDFLLECIDPLGYVEDIQNTPWVDYINNNVITVRPDVVTIDGVSYSEIWLGPDAANALRLQGLDFTSAYNILSNQSEAITYAEGYGSIAGLPAYEVNGEVITQNFGFTQPQDWTKIGNDYYWRVARNGSKWNLGYSTSTDGGMSTISSYNDGPFEMHYRKHPNNSYYCFSYKDSGGWHNQNNNRGSDVVYDPFSFDYVSGNINAEPDPEDGLLLRVPSSYNDGTPGSVVNYDIHDLINIYPQLDDTDGHDLIFDPNLNPDFEADIDLGNAIGDLITAVIIAKLAELLGDDAEVIYAPFPEKDDPSPVDPDLPDPEVPIGEQDPIWLDDLMRWIKNAIDNLGDTIHDAIDHIHEDLQEIIEQIGDLVDNILEDIELGPAKLFDKALDILKTLFLPLLLPIRAMLNLWHYVVEWISSITSPFTWIFGIMSGTSGNMVLPIYALLAGGICISIYKALGR